MHPQHRIPRWIRIIVWILRLVIGVTLFYAPWYWDQNQIFLRFPTLGDIAALGAVRGMVTGLGLLNIWIAFQDAIRHWDG
jgi:hypothetical protein